jgi:CubicO group peptidase (beta-lactamase class C family)
LSGAPLQDWREPAGTFDLDISYGVLEREEGSFSVGNISIGGQVRKTARFRRLRIGVLFSAAVVCASAVRSQEIARGTWRGDVDAFARQVVDSGLAPGLALAVCERDWVLHVKGFGAADRDTARPVSGDTPFYIASSTKAFTALATALLAERGQIDLDAPLSRYLPGLTLRAPLSADAITIRSLLTMTHGIEDGGPVVFRAAYSGDFSHDLLIRLLRDYGPSATGRAFHYGNLGYNILGLVLEARTGMSWKDVVRREVIEPAQMTETNARLSELGGDRLALPHELHPEGWRRIALKKTDANLHAAGGHFSSARDLGRFLAAELGGGSIEGSAVFPAGVIARTQKQSVDQDRDFGPFHRFGWGLGWDLCRYEEEVVVSRFGSFAGYFSHLSFMPDRGIGVAVLVNGDEPASSAADLVATYAYDRLLGKPELERTYAERLRALQSRAESYKTHLPQELARRAARQKPLPHPLSDYAGIYENPRFGRMEWRVVAGGLEVHVGVASDRAEVFDAAANQVRVEFTGNGEVVTFRFPNAGGPASSLRYADEEWTRR